MEEEEVVAAEVVVVVVEMVEEEMEIGVVLTQGSDCISLWFIEDPFFLPV